MARRPEILCRREADRVSSTGKHRNAANALSRLPTDLDMKRARTRCGTLSRQSTPRASRCAPPDATLFQRDNRRFTDPAYGSSGVALIRDQVRCRGQGQPLVTGQLLAFRPHLERSFLHRRPAAAAFTGRSGYCRPRNVGAAVMLDGVPAGPAQVSMLPDGRSPRVHPAALLACPLHRGRHRAQAGDDPAAGLGRVDHVVDFVQ